MSLEDITALPMAVVRACFGKQRFAFRHDAMKALKHHLRRGRPTSLNVYRCEHCSGFHIGNRFS
jgi:hypothetical protein